MALVLFMLAVSVALGATVKRVGIEVYIGLFLVSAAASVAFLFGYFKLFF